MLLKFIRSSVQKETNYQLNLSFHFFRSVILLHYFDLPSFFFFFFYSELVSREIVKEKRAEIKDTNDEKPQSEQQNEK